MADNALGALFSHIADAIRSKTASTDTMKPNDFPAKILSIAQIINESGGEYVPPDSSATSLKIQCGQFYTSYENGRRMQTIEHGLGTVPEFVLVYGGGIGEEFWVNGTVSVPKLVYAYGFHSAFANQITPNLGAINFTVGFQWTTEKGIDEDEEKVGFITNCDSEKFLVGYDADRYDGYFEFEADQWYYWIAISGLGSAGSGGGSMEGVHTVTFMSEDGQTELFKRPVADGDNCADPVARELMDEPTKESTNTQTFAHAGWSAAAGGSADDSILNAVTEDKTVYAAFEASTRYYTIRFFDGDTLLHTVLAEYGSIPTYTPSKENVSFSGWLPEIVVVSSDADYQAQWVESVTFADASWEKIAEICEAGNADKMFALGDTKTLVFTGVNGYSNTVTMEIVGFNHDDLADGSGKAGISLVSKTTVNGYAVTQVAQDLTAGWASGYSQVRSILNSSILNTFPEALQNCIKEVKKQSSGPYATATSLFESTDKIFIPSVTEVAGAAVYSASNQGSLYEYYKTQTNRIKYDASGNTVKYYTRSVYKNQNGRMCDISRTGTIGYSGMDTSSYWPIAFCI